jgi:signal peptidase I
MTAAIGLLAAMTAAAAAFVAARRILVIVTVRGISMAPTYHEGDRVLVLRVRRLAARRGAVIVFTHPRDAGKGPWLIKRVVAVTDDPTPELVPERLRHPAVPAGHVVVSGENPSYDSRWFGYLPLQLVRGVVIAGLARSPSRRPGLR